MCLNPIQIKNPLLGHAKDSKYMAAKDCHSQYIYVPCGHCAECCAKRQADLIQRLKFEEKSYYLYFVTLTYDNAHLPYLSLDDAEGKEQVFPYANFKHVQDMFKRFRKNDVFGRPFRYIAVSEYGKRHGRPHFHIIFLLKKYADDNEFESLRLEKLVYDNFKSGWSINIGTNKFPVYESLFTYQERYEGRQLKSNFDAHLVIPFGADGTADVAYYVTKYIMKSSKIVDAVKMRLKSCFTDDVSGKAMFRDYWRLIAPKCVKSLYFGLNPISSPIGVLYDESITSCIRKGLLDSVRNNCDYPHVFDPVNGNFVPMSNYYSKKFMHFEEQLYFSSKRIDPFTSALYVGADCPVSDYSMKNMAVRMSRARLIDKQIGEKYASSVFISEQNGELPEIFYDSGF